MSASQLSTRFAHDGKLYASKAFHKMREKFLAVANSRKDIDVTEAVTAAGYMAISLYTVSFLVNLALGF